MSFFLNSFQEISTLVHKLRSRNQTEQQGTDSETAYSVHVQVAAEVHSNVSVENVF